MKSTVDQPLRFFETFIISDIKTFVKEKVTDFRALSGFYIREYDLEIGEVKYWDLDSDDPPKGYIYSIKDELYKLLLKEFKNSKDLLNEAATRYASNKNEFQAFLILQRKSFLYIIDKGKENIERFPLLLKPIEGLINYINKKYLNEDDYKIVVDMSNLMTIKKDQKLTNEQKINAILGYMKFNNKKGKKIMSDEHYDLMIACINEYIETNKKPEIKQRIGPVNISKNLLRFTFWALHKHLYTTRPIRTDFVVLIKELFVDFDAWEFSTLKTKFGNRYKVTYKGIKFIPEIIKDELISTKQPLFI